MVGNKNDVGITGRESRKGAKERAQVNIRYLKAENKADRCV
ncbi:UNVERIFIED_ORG: hypothetical protein DFS12_10738 [Chitinophaga ginsengisegetis]|nr:hypothetical protein [Chitinophaga ginsengisegetis]MDR6649611.1 hypothetical protein [Chitinophaga ginsengisegetis]MDR6656186.1 hypothetical protein [Chitinophaga ginsengisegetis]